VTEAVGWYPVAASHDLPVGHIYQTRLFDCPLAIWRASSGEVNIWQDRCPHRGVRFSIGTALGDELRCQYHAWRFASGSGSCTLIPAHRDRPPPRTIRATVYPVVEYGGLVWSSIVDGESHPPIFAHGVVLRAIPVFRPAAAVEGALTSLGLRDVKFFVQPIASDRSVIRGVAIDDASLLEYDALLERLRRELEAS